MLQLQFHFKIESGTNITIVLSVANYRLFFCDQDGGQLVLQFSRAMHALSKLSSLFIEIA